MLKSQDVLVDNIKRYYSVGSIRKVPVGFGISHSVLLNWSGHRSSPSIMQLDSIAYEFNVSTHLLLEREVDFSSSLSIYKVDLMGIEEIFYENVGRLRYECDINVIKFNEKMESKIGMTYRTYLAYVNRKRKRVNLAVLDKLARLYRVESSELLKKRSEAR